MDLKWAWVTKYMTTISLQLQNKLWVNYAQTNEKVRKSAKKLPWDKILIYSDNLKNKINWSFFEYNYENECLYIKPENLQGFQFS